MVTSGQREAGRDKIKVWVKVLVTQSRLTLLLSHGLKPARFLGQWNSPGKNTGVGSHSLLQGMFLTQGSNPGLPHCRQILYPLSHQGSPHRWDMAKKWKKIIENRIQRKTNAVWSHLYVESLKKNNNSEKEVRLVVARSSERWGRLGAGGLKCKLSAVR